MTVSRSDQASRRRLVLLAGLTPLWLSLAACRASPAPTLVVPAGAARGTQTFIYFYADN